VDARKQRTIVLRGQTNAVYAVAVTILTILHLFDNRAYRPCEATSWCSTPSRP
jgi:hypothetical protein